MTQNGAVEKTQGGELTIGKKITDLRDLLNSKAEELNAVLDDPLAVRRLIMVALSAAQRTPKLLECTRSSILLALVEAGSVNLEPSGILGQAALVPFKNTHTQRLEAVFMPMYQGLIEVAYRSGEVTTIYAREVYPGDTFAYWFGANPGLNHTPDDTHEDFNKDSAITHFYAAARLKNGAVVFEVMTRDQVEKVKAASAAGDKGPWKDWYSLMGRKTVIKRLWKILPKSPEMRAIVAKDDSIEAGEPMPLEMIDPALPSQRAADATRQGLDDLKTGMGTPPAAEEEQEPPEQVEAEVVESSEEPPAEPEEPIISPEDPDYPAEQVGAQEPSEEPERSNPTTTSEGTVEESSPEPQTQLPLDKSKAYQRINIHWGNRFKELGIELEKKVKDDLLKRYLGVESLKDVEDSRLLLILNSVAGAEDREAVKHWITNACKSLGI